MTKLQASEKKPKAILWAIDLFESDNMPSPSAVSALRRLQVSQGVEIYPLYVAARSSIAGDKAEGEPIASLRVRLDQFVKQSGVPARPGQVLVNEESTRDGAIHQLLHYARDRKVEWIALSSHGRAGLSRLVVGSFAESLLRECPWPVLFLARKSASATTAENGPILFATDFSESSRVAFRDFLQAKALEGKRVTLYHSILFPLAFAQGESQYVPENFFEEEERKARLEAEAWVQDARAAGVAVDLLVRDGGVGTNAGAPILKVAKDLEAEMIVMASASNLVERALFGSSAYEVFRAGQFPVLLYGPGTLGSADRSSGSEGKRLS